MSGRSPVIAFARPSTIAVCRHPSRPRTAGCSSPGGEHVIARWSSSARPIRGSSGSRPPAGRGPSEVGQRLGRRALWSSGSRRPRRSDVLACTVLRMPWLTKSHVEPIDGLLRQQETAWESGSAYRATSTFCRRRPDPCSGSGVQQRTFSTDGSRGSESVRSPLRVDAFDPVEIPTRSFSGS